MMRIMKQRREVVYLLSVQRRILGEDVGELEEAEEDRARDVDELVSLVGGGGRGGVVDAVGGWGVELFYALVGEGSDGVCELS